MSGSRRGRCGIAGAEPRLKVGVMENRIDIAAFSDTGTELGHNEDHCGKLQLDGSRGVVVVADGMATFEGGDLASSRAILGFLREFREQPFDRSLSNRVLRAARGANFEVYDMAVVVPQLRGMSTTLTAVAVEAGKVACAHVGNGRVYRLRGGTLEQLSKDHTVLAESPNPLSFAGPGSRVFRDDNQLTRSLGRELIVTVDLFETTLAPGESLIVCTDGLYNVITEREIAELAAEGPASEACLRLIAKANSYGTLDNLSVAMVRAA